MPAPLPAPAIPPDPPGVNSYAAALTNKSRNFPRLKEVHLAHRLIHYMGSVPGLFLTRVEEEEFDRAREHTLIMKFTTGKPRLSEIREFIAANWGLEKQLAIGYLDLRHVTMNMENDEDLKEALLKPTPKILICLFRIFRWYPEFEVGRDSPCIAVWVKLHNVPLKFYNAGALRKLGELIGPVLQIDSYTLDLIHQVYARLCIEIDFTQHRPEQLWIGTNTKGCYIDVEYGGNHAFCKYCGLLGHEVGLCRKKRQSQGKGADEQVQEMAKEKPSQPNKNKTVKIWSQKQGGSEETSHEPPKFLTKSVDGVSDDTRQTLEDMGLITEETKSPGLYTHKQRHEKATGKEENKSLCLNSQEQGHEKVVADKSKQATHSNIEDGSRFGEDVVMKGNTSTVLTVHQQGSGSGGDNPCVDDERDTRVFTTPTKNRFDALTLEDEGQRTNYTSTALIPILEDHEQSFSDGSGNKSESTMGIPKPSSCPSLGDEGDGYAEQRRGSKARIKRKIKSSSDS